MVRGFAYRFCFLLRQCNSGVLVTKDKWLSQQRFKLNILITAYISGILARGTIKQVSASGATNKNSTELNSSSIFPVAGCVLFYQPTHSRGTTH